MQRSLLKAPELEDERSLMTLVENRTSYSFELCELNFFETRQTTNDVKLQFDEFVLTSMLRGKKVMKLPEKEAFDYLPGESCILSPGELMTIDFPEAQKLNPTQCLALRISDDIIRKTIELLNEKYPKVSGWGKWDIEASIYHLINNQNLSDTINRLMDISRDESIKAKDVMVELTLQEMIVRLMQTQARYLFEKSYKELAGQNPLAHAIEYIHKHLSEKINPDIVTEKAGMSRACFYKKFKETMGITPSQYVMTERIKRAKKYLRNPKNTIKSVAYSSGFENVAHFVKSFRAQTGETPGAYQKKIQSR